jgi:prepilin-type N-terminal cleavage/methylation domain-containing protein
MRHDRRSGLTLIEMLVTIVAAAVVIAGLATVVVQMLSDQKDISISREQAYARVRATGEITWTLKQAGRRGIRQVFATHVRDADDPNGPVIAGMDDVGGAIGVPWTGPRVYPGAIQARGVITYVIDNYDQPEAALDPARARTGIIYQFDSVVYRFERPMSAAGVPGRVAPAGVDPGDPPVSFGSDRSTSGFNSLNSGALAAFVNSAANRDQSEVLAIGVDRLEVNYVRDARADVPANRWSIRWNLIFFKN